MSQHIRIVVVDDHNLFRHGLIGLLSEMENIQVVGDAVNGREALDVIAHTKPDLILLDVNMPVMDGIATVKALRTQTECRILMLTISKQQEDLIGAIQAGADGYLLKNAEPDELRNAIFHIMKNKSVLSPEITKQVFQAISEPVDSEAIVADLTRRELDVLRCVAQEKTTNQISKDLYISKNTVKTHIRNILAKLDVNSRTEAVTKAVRFNLI